MSALKKVACKRVVLGLNMGAIKKFKGIYSLQPHEVRGTSCMRVKSKLSTLN